MPAFLDYQVADVMTCRPTVVARHTPLVEVLRLLEEHDFNSLPVTQDGALIGVVTRLGVLKAVASGSGGMVPPYAEIVCLPAESVMTEPSATVGPTTPLTAAVQRMVETGYHSLPVLIGALLIGIVTRQDVLRALHSAAVVPGRKEDEVHGRPDPHP